MKVTVENTSIGHFSEQNRAVRVSIEGPNSDRHGNLIIRSNNYGDGSLPRYWIYWQLPDGTTRTLGEINEEGELIT